MVKRKNPMPSYYGKNIVRHAQKKFFQRKALEASREKRRDNPAAEAVESGKKNKLTRRMELCGGRTLKR